MAKATKSKQKTASNMVVPEEIARQNFLQRVSGRIKTYPIRTGVIVLAILLICALSYGYIHTRSQLELAKNPEAAGKSESEKIANGVKKYIALPQETPTLATIKDISKLSNQSFFVDAHNGDKVLIFPKAKKALIYRPSTHQIIEFSAVSFNSAQ